MSDQISAVLVHDGLHNFLALEAALKNRSIRIDQVRNCRDLAAVIVRGTPPHLVFADIVLPDGSWEDVLRLTAEAREPVNLIVVGRAADTGFYLEALRGVAFDFVSPGMDPADLNYIVRTSVENILRRREAYRRLCSPRGDNSKAIVLCSRSGWGDE